MKIYAVVDNVDLGYQVQKCFYHLKDAEEEVQYLNNELYQRKISYEIANASYYEKKDITYDEAKERTDKWFDWNQYTVEEFEVI